MLIFLFSLFLIFRISYKKIIKKVISLTPDMQTIKDNIKTSYISMKNDNYEEEYIIEKPKKFLKNITNITKKISISKKNDLDDYEKIIKEEIKKNDKQLKIEDAPQKIKIEEKNNSSKNPFSSKKSFLNFSKQEELEDEEIKEENKKNIEFDSWKLPTLDLLDNPV